MGFQSSTITERIPENRCRQCNSSKEELPKIDSQNANVDFFPSLQNGQLLTSQVEEKILASNVMTMLFRNVHVKMFVSLLVH